MNVQTEQVQEVQQAQNLSIEKQIEKKFIARMDEATLSQGFKLLRQTAYRDLLVQIEERDRNKSSFQERFKPTAKAAILSATDKKGAFIAFTRTFSPIDLMRTDWRASDVLNAMYKACGYKDADDEVKVIAFLGKSYYKDINFILELNETERARIDEFCPLMTSVVGYNHSHMDCAIHEAALAYGNELLSKMEKNYSIFEAVENPSEDITAKLAQYSEKIVAIEEKIQKLKDVAPERQMTAEDILLIKQQQEEQAKEDAKAF